MSDTVVDERNDTKTDPGASRHGNFMNYYQFHPAEERVRQLPHGVWRVAHPVRKYAGLDVGCNAGVRAAAVRDVAETGWFGCDPKLQTARLILAELSLFRYRSRRHPLPVSVFYPCWKFRERVCLFAWTRGVSFLFVSTFFFYWANAFS